MALEVKIVYARSTEEQNLHTQFSSGVNVAESGGGGGGFFLDCEDFCENVQQYIPCLWGFLFCFF